MHPVSIAIVEPTKGLFCLKLREIWHRRELLFFLAWRDLKARHAQTAIGLAWAVVQPLVLMIVFAIVFGNIARVPSEGIPYPIFLYSALVPWTYLTKSLDRSSFSVVAESSLVTKVYFPRIVIPLSATAGGLVDFAIAFVLLVGMMFWYGILPSWNILTVPFFLLLTVATTLSVSLWLAALYVKHRDIAALVPLIAQVWLFASPVIYPASLVPDRWQWLYNLNPMVGVIEGFRWALLNKPAPSLGPMILNALVISGLLICGMAYFNRTERAFADVI